MSAATIALCMIVRNEAEVIERCLRSVQGLIDTWVICDTGSTDGTRELVRTALGHLPGRLHDSDWVDFGHNRSELMELAHGAADYLLLIDADMTVERRAPLPQLEADAYLLRETGDLDFGVMRLVRGDRRWWYEGSTHEYLATDGRFEQAELDALAIAHHADGSARADKLLRDVALLKRDLARDPDNPRAAFYLAQTYRDMGKRELAIECYRRRVELGGWDEEVFYANLQEGTLRVEEDLAAGVAVLLEAWQRRPTRAEPLHELARAYRQREEYALAHLFADRGLQLEYPSDVLFIHRWVYDWGLRLERALAAAALDRPDEAKADLEAMLEVDALPEHVDEYVRERLAELGKRPDRRRPDGIRGGPARLSALAPGVQIGEIKLDVRPAWPVFNPSIARDGDGFRMVARTANYQIERGVLHDDGVLHNLNYLVALDANLAVTGIEPIVDGSTGPRRYPSAIQGYEDCRLFEVDGRWHATATVCDLNPDDRREIALLTLDGPEIVSVHGLAGPGRNRHEKNWMPFLVDGELHLLYSCGPTVVLRCDPATGTVEQVSRERAPTPAKEFRGGSQGIEVDDGHLFVIHEVNRGEPAMRYLHRFVLLDRAFELSAVSRPFTFTGDRIEFCAGMARRGGELVLSFGVSDAAAGLAVMPMDEVMGSLQETARRLANRPS